MVKALADKCDTIDKQAKYKESLAPKEHCQEKMHAISDETNIKSSIQQSSVVINLEGTLDVKCDEIKLLQVDINHSCSKGMNRKIDDEAGSSKLAKYVSLDLPQLSSKSCKNKRSRNSYGKKRPKPVLEEYNPGAPSPLDSLSDEIIVKIFEYLPRTTLVKGCAITCRRLRNISYDEALWKRVDLAGKKLGNVLFTCGAGGREGRLSQGTWPPRLSKVSGRLQETMLFKAAAPRAVRDCGRHALAK